jgi:hypothetical protein
MKGIDFRMPFHSHEEEEERERGGGKKRQSLDTYSAIEKPINCLIW